jgi:hypothetical protein
MVDFSIVADWMTVLLHNWIRSALYVAFAPTVFFTYSHKYAIWNVDDYFVIVVDSSGFFT